MNAGCRTYSGGKISHWPGTEVCEEEVARRIPSGQGCRKGGQASVLNGLVAVDQSSFASWPVPSVSQKSYRVATWKTDRSISRNFFEDLASQAFVHLALPEVFGFFVDFAALWRLVSTL